MNQDNIGNFIGVKRREKNLTQEQLAQKLGVSNKTISKGVGELSRQSLFFYINDKIYRACA